MYRCAKQHSEPTGDRRGANVDELTLTPLELIDRIAALVPPPRTHRHRYFAVAIEVHEPKGFGRFFRWCAQYAAGRCA